MSFNFPGKDKELEGIHEEEPSFYDENVYLRPTQEGHGRPLQELESRPMNMNLPGVRRGFPFWDKFLASCTGCARACTSSESNYITRGCTSEQMQQESLQILERNPQLQERYGGKVFYLKIHDTNGLELDPHIIHPFVRMHILALNTQCYLAKSAAQSALHLHENVGQFNQLKEYSSGPSPFLLPFATAPCDLRVKGENDPHWDEEFLLDEDAAHILTPNTLILFEILDFNFRLVKEKSKLLRQDKFYPVAWAFLRPIGSSTNHLGVSKLQLYRFKYRPPAAAYESRRPGVLYDFNWFKKSLYPSFLRVELRALEAPPRRIVHYPPQSVFQIEEGYKPWREMQEEARRPRKLVLAGQEELDAESLARAKRLTKWRRLAHEHCQVPSSLVYKLDSSSAGCWRLSFSHNGHYLAAGCTSELTTIKIFELSDGKLAATLRGHADLIHDFEWSADDSYLLSCSSDGTAKVWDFSGGLESCRGNLPCSLPHGSYVYTGTFHLEQSFAEMLIIATGSYDGKVRVWQYMKGSAKLMNEVQIVPEQQLSYGALQEQQVRDSGEGLAERCHPNCLQFDRQDTLYVGDSLGLIHLFAVTLHHEHIELAPIRQVQLDELAQDPISSLILQPPEFRSLLVQSRDNVIRRIEPPRYAQADEPDLIDTRFFGAQIQKFNVRACVSPDGKLLLSGSEDGRVYMWDIASGFSVDLAHWEVRLKDLVSDVAWNETYNMVAVAGFGSELPILVFCYEKTQEEVEQGLAGAGFPGRNEDLAPHNEQRSALSEFPSRS